MLRWSATSLRHVGDRPASAPANILRFPAEGEGGASRTRSKRCRFLVMTSDMVGSKLATVMARKIRVEYEGAIYHLMNRGDRKEPIFRDDADRLLFLETPGQACAKTDWQVHAYCLMTFKVS